MPEIINVGEAKMHWSKLLDRVRDGEEIILAKAGKPYARMVPYVPKRRSSIVSGMMADEFFEPPPEEE